MMEQITFNPNNEPYYSEDFIKGFKCGAQRQFEADKADRPQGEWIALDDTSNGYWKCSVCETPTEAIGAKELYKFCPFCNADMRGKEQ